MHIITTVQLETAVLLQQQWPRIIRTKSDGDGLMAQHHPVSSESTGWSASTVAVQYVFVSWNVHELSHFSTNLCRTLAMCQALVTHKWTNENLWLWEAFMILRQWFATMWGAIVKLPLRKIATLAGVAQWIECLSANQKVASSIPSLRHMPGLRARSPVWGVWEATTHWYLPPVPSLKIIKS